MNEQMVEEEVTSLFRVRRTLLEMLEDRGYAVLNTPDDLLMSRERFEESFKAANYNRDSLTMLRQRQDGSDDQIYVFFPDETRGKAIGIKPISERVQRMERDQVKRAIIVLQTGLTSYARNTLDALTLGDGASVEVFLENELLVNITRHQLVPKHELMTYEQKKMMLQRYKVKESQLPRIQKKDPIARYYGLKYGDVVKITRPSDTAGRYVTYRLCVG